MKKEKIHRSAHKICKKTKLKRGEESTNQSKRRKARIVNDVRKRVGTERSRKKGWVSGKRVEDIELNSAQKGEEYSFPTIHAPEVSGITV